MKIISYSQLPSYDVCGNALSIFWGEEYHSPDDAHEEPYWSYYYCAANASDTRNAIIEKIMSTQYPTYGAELAAVINGGPDAEAHEALRVLAKSLADGWVNR